MCHSNSGMGLSSKLSEFGTYYVYRVFSPEVCPTVWYQPYIPYLSRTPELPESGLGGGLSYCVRVSVLVTVHPIPYSRLSRTLEVTA